MRKKTALIVGSSGLVGNELLEMILNGQEYERVYTIVRNSLGIKHQKLTEVVCNFNDLHDQREYFKVDDVFCCLGTTIKKAKTKEQMFKVDVEYPVVIGKLAKEEEANHFLVISSMNANSRSLFSYQRMKGILEERIQSIPLKTISIFRPSLLLGERKEFRLAETIASKIINRFSFLLKDTWKSRLAIEANKVAQGMYQVAQMDSTGVNIYASHQIEAVAVGKGTSRHSN